MKTDRPTTRAGFTMIEILIVITLIAVLSSILVSLVQGVLGTSRQAATKSTIIKISRMLEDRVEAFHRFMDKLDNRAGDERFPRYVTRRHWVQAGGRRKLALILARKDEFRRHFPQMFSEDNDYNFNLNRVIPNWPEFNPDGTPTGYNVTAHQKQKETESAECLYYFLTQGETFGAEPVSADAFTSSEVTDADGDGLLEFVDSWGNPLRFYRWPTRLIRPNPSRNGNDLANTQWVENLNNNRLFRSFKFRIDETAAAVVFGPLPSVSFGVPRLPKSGGATLGQELEDPLSRDGDDPLGLTHRWLNNVPGYDFRMSPAQFERRYHTPDTYHIPLILSAGADGRLGLYEPYEGGFIPNPNNRNEFLYKVTNFGRLAQPISSSANSLVVDESLHDNISNLFLRSGGSR